MRYTIFSLTLLGSFLLLQGCPAPVLIAGAGAGGYYVGKDERKVGTIVDDASITTSINTKLIGTKGVSTFDIDVDTHKGIVTLKGKVPSKRIEQKVIKICEDTDGVKKVISKLKIQAD